MFPGFVETTPTVRIKSRQPGMEGRPRKLCHRWTAVSIEHGHQGVLLLIDIVIGHGGPDGLLGDVGRWRYWGSC